jgi:hypothetical protein
MLRYEGDGFTFLPEEGVLQIFIALKNPSPSAGYENANLGSNEKHANHYTTEEVEYLTTTTPYLGLHM